MSFSWNLKIDENKCCGWTNVFDYCSSVAVLGIALRALSYQEMMNLYNELNNPENSVDYGIDSNYDLDYIDDFDDEDYGKRRRRSMTSWEIRSSLRIVFRYLRAKILSKASSENSTKK